MPHATLHTQLLKLGLNDLEARTYVALIKSGPATAYSIGRAIAKPTANVYKAADSLEARGAIISSPGEKRLLQPVPPDEFLAHLRRRQDELLEGVASGLRALRSAPAKVGLFQLENVDAVLERARRMLSAATTLAVVDAFPLAVERLRKDIEAASARGVKVYVQVYAPTSVRCESLVEVSGGADVLALWKSEQLNVVIDAKEVLLALCGDRMHNVIEAYWSNSLYLACMQQAGFLREHAFHQVRRLADSGEATPRKLARILDGNPSFGTTAMPGQRELAARIAHTKEEWERVQ